MGSQRRRGAELDAAIHDAVFAELDQHGYQNLTFEGVARRARTSKPVLYRRWPTRVELVVAALVHQRLGAVHAVDAGSMADDMRQTLRLVLTQLDTTGLDVARGVLAEAADSQGSATLRILQSKGVELTDEILERARERGELSDAYISERIRRTPFDLVRSEFIVGGELTPQVIDEIVDDVFVRLVISTTC